MQKNDLICRVVLSHYPATQGIYLFGSQLSKNRRSDGDVDVAVLLTHVQAKKEKSLAFSECRFELERAFGCSVDLLNARCVSTVFQKEIIFGKLIYCADKAAVEEFEMLTLSYYQKLNEERAGILESFLKTGRAYPV